MTNTPQPPERVWRCETCGVIAVPDVGQPCWDAGHPHAVVQPRPTTSESARALEAATTPDPNPVTPELLAEDGFDV